MKNGNDKRDRKEMSDVLKSVKQKLKKQKAKWTKSEISRLLVHWNNLKSSDEHPIDNLKVINILADMFEEDNYDIQMRLRDEGVSIDEIDNQEDMLWNDVAINSTHTYIANLAGGSVSHLKYDVDANERYEAELPHFFVFWRHSISESYRENISYINEMCSDETQTDVGRVKAELQEAYHIILLHHYSEWFKVMTKLVNERKQFGINRETSKPEGYRYYD